MQLNQEKIIRSKISEIVANDIGLKKEKLLYNKMLTRYGYDSLHIAELLCELEKEFDIKINDEEIYNLGISINNLTFVINKQKLLQNGEVVYSFESWKDPYVGIHDDNQEKSE